MTSTDPAPPRTHPVYVIFHADCRDGFGAAWAAWTALGDNRVHYIPSKYGEAPPGTDPRGTVHILDFSYDLPTMQALLARHHGRVNLLDHHKTAQEALDGRIAGATFDMNRSGAVMAWEHFHPAEPVPELLLYVQDRDLWNWKLPASREINEALQQTALEFPLWSALTIPALLEEGTRLRAPAMEQVRANLARASISTVLGTGVPSVETDQLMSDTAEQLLIENPHAPFAAVYYHTEQDCVPATKFSLRSKKGGTDVSAIAHVLGGGGHANAAGFVIADGDRIPGRPDLHGSDTRHHGDHGLMELARTSPEDRDQNQQAAVNKIQPLQLAANENALLLHNNPDGAARLRDQAGQGQMNHAHQVASTFQGEIPRPSVPLDPDPDRDADLKRAHYPGALSFPTLQDIHDRQDSDQHRTALADETEDLPF